MVLSLLVAVALLAMLPTRVVATGEQQVTAEESPLEPDVVEHAGEHAGEEHENEPLELPNLTMLLRAFVLTPGSAAYRYSEIFENAFFAVLAGLFLCLVALRIYKNRAILPGRLQVFAEMIVEWLEGLACTMMGPKTDGTSLRSSPPSSSYIASTNIHRPIPLGKSPTSTWLNTLSIALVVFIYVQYTGIKRQGIKGYLHHLAGSPKDVVGWCSSPSCRSPSSSSESSSSQ